MAAEDHGATRRDFLYIAAGGMGAVGTIAAIVQLADAGKIVAFPQVGGLHHRYERLAA